MKKLLLSALLVGLTASAFAQGQINLDNNQNTNGSPAATTSGLFFLNNGSSTAPINQDFNAAFYGGTDATSLALIATFSGANAVGSSGAGPGTWTDPSASSYIIPGSTTTAFFRIEAWTGPATSFAAAVSAAAQGTFGVSSGIFSNPVGFPPASPPDLVNMPGLTLSSLAIVPEPSTFALAGLGAAAMLIFRRRK